MDSSRRIFIGAAGAAGLVTATGAPLSAWAADKKVVIGVVYVGPRDDFGYNQAQAQAAAILKKMPNVKVIEEEKVPETVAVQKSMEAMISQDKAALIFATSFGYFDPHMLKVAEKFPNVRFAHGGGLWTEGKHPKNTGSYFGYIDGAQYVAGVVAGHMSKKKKLGFVAAKPIPQVLRNINAFTLGARSVDPSITTQVIFTGDWSIPVKEAEATNSLVDQGVDVVTCHVDAPKVVIETAEKRGIMSQWLPRQPGQAGAQGLSHRRRVGLVHALQEARAGGHRRQADVQLRAWRHEGRIREDVGLWPVGVGQGQGSG
jgi:basic membrane protein A